MKNIVLVGFMGAGKTSVAKHIADVLEREFISTDELIEEKAGISINKIFKEMGEPHFRELEHDVIQEISRQEDLVIDAGGGVVIDASNIENLRKNGVVFCLNATPEELLKRTEKETHRPLLKVKNPLLEIRKILRCRMAYYEKADHQIDTTAKSIDQISKKIIEIYKKKKD